MTKSHPGLRQNVSDNVSISLTDDVIDVAACQRTRDARDDCGAQLWFQGVSRRQTQVNGETKVTDTLDYEAHHSMAMSELEKLAHQTIDKFGVTWLTVVHRLGSVPPGEVSLLLGIGSPHRREAIDATDWFIEHLKKDVPIWKRETWQSGIQQWVHPSKATEADSKPRIYLDHAATGWPKSDVVLDAMMQYLKQNGASVGRGNYSDATQAADILRKLRHRLAEQIGCFDSSGIAIMPSATIALNVAISGLLKPGDHVVTTTAEHNAVLRPLEHLKKEKEIDWDLVPTQSDGSVSIQDLSKAIRKDTAMVCISTASNVTGRMMPTSDLAEMLRDRETILLCDAAQSFGWMPVDVSKDIDVLVAPAHKASGGPPGVAMLYVNGSLHDRIEPLHYGGTGHDGESLQMPTVMPGKLEPGTHNMPAIAGWLAALEELDAAVVSERTMQALQLGTHLESSLRDAGANTLGSAGEVPVVPFWIDGMDSETVAAILDSEFGIQVRAGKHCAAKIHESIPFPQDGVVRASAGPKTTEQEIGSLAEAVRQIVG